jgi:amino acid adenylation domain-containing protein
LVAARAAENPGLLALQAGPATLTYQQLDRSANRLANYLRSLGIRADVPVGLCLPRSLDLVIGALGIMKAGGAYVPLDPAYPLERLVFMLGDAGAPVLVSRRCLAERFPSADREIVDLDAPEIARQSDRPPPIPIAPEQLAYVIYTSGSTGRPKGVEITHANLENLVSWHTHAFSVTAADRASQVAGVGFDAAVWELWPYLAVGASVHFPDEETRNSAELLWEWLVAQEISIGFIPTPLTEILLGLSVKRPRKAGPRIVLTGGDTLHHFPPPGLPFVLVNNYGPTECTVVATSGRVLSKRSPTTLPPIGNPIANTEICILDEHLQPVPAGMPGEIHIGGAGVGRGYRNRPDLTAERFITDPFSAEPGSRLYKTGDLARLLPDGQILFLGRVDDQIKIRGYRIEPNEIVSVLNRHESIRASVVVAREDGVGDKRLLAYVVSTPDVRITYTVLRTFISEFLPDYMIPTVFVRINELPLTPNGKIDRAALPDPTSANILLDDVSAEAWTETERRVAEIVGELLKLESVGRDENFFLLGGHSLLGAQLVARLREIFGVEIKLRSLFEAPSVSALSAEVERLRGNGTASEAAEAGVVAI